MCHEREHRKTVCIKRKIFVLLKYKFTFNIISFCRFVAHTAVISSVFVFYYYTFSTIMSLKYLGLR